MAKFYVGEKVKVKSNLVQIDTKWKGQTVFILSVHGTFSPVMYSCESIDGTKLAFYETELQSLYEHDMGMLKF